MYLDKEVKLANIDDKRENILKNLMSLYLHDLSEFADDLMVNEEGMYEYDGIDCYFKDNDLRPLLIYYKEKLAGFVLLNSGKYAPKEVDYCVHELFVSKSYRGKGVATEAVKMLLEQYKGKYTVVQLANNKIAVDFWKGVYKKFNINYEEITKVVDGFKCYVQTF